MPRYDDRNSSTRLFVGRLSSRTRSRDLEDLFCRYGRVRNVDMKHDFAFVEFSDPRDADDARYSLNGRDVDGSRITVEFAKGAPHASGGSREYLGKGPPPGSGRCFNCGLDGHWARDCKSGDWKNKCYRCGDRGHIERNCKNSPKKLRRESSYSQSPSPRRGRSRSPSHSRGRNYSRSKSPVKRERSVERSERRSRSPKRPRRTSPPPSKSRRHRSPPSEERISRKRVSISPKDRRKNNRSDYSGSPRARGRSPKVDSVSPRARSPKVDSVSPRARTRSPKVDSVSPRAMSRSPGVNSVSPRARTRSPKVDSVSPRARSKSPKVDTEADGAIKRTNEENDDSRSPSPGPLPSSRGGSPVEDDNGSQGGSESV